MAVVRLGDRRVWRSGWRLLVGFLRQVRLTSLVAHYRNGLKRMKAFYVALMRDLIDGAATIEAVRSQMLVESYFAVPMVPVTVVSSQLPPSPPHPPLPPSPPGPSGGPATRGGGGRGRAPGGGGRLAKLSPLLASAGVTGRLLPVLPSPFSSRIVRWAGDTRQRRAVESCRRRRSASK